MNIAIKLYIIIDAHKYYWNLNVIDNHHIIITNCYLVYLLQNPLYTSRYRGVKETQSLNQLH